MRFEYALESNPPHTPTLANLVLVGRSPIGGREQRRGAFDRESHDCGDRKCRLTITEHTPHTVTVEVAVLEMYVGSSEKTIPPPRELLDNVELHPGRMREIDASAWRGDVEKEKMRIVPHANRALGRQVRTPLWCHGGREAEMRGLDDRPHVGSEHLDPRMLLRDREV